MDSLGYEITIILLSVKPWEGGKVVSLFIPALRCIILAQGDIDLNRYKEPLVISPTIITILYDILANIATGSLHYNSLCKAGGFA